MCQTATNALKANVKTASLFSESTVRQLHSVFERMTGRVTLRVSYNSSDVGQDLLAYMTELGKYSDKISLISESAENIRPFVEILDHDGQKTGLEFHGLPGGHEFTAFVLGIYNVAGPGQPLDEALIEKIQAISKETDLKIFVLPDCTLCPDLVIAAQKIASLNSLVSARAYEISEYQDLVDKFNIRGVPALMINEDKVLFGPRNIAHIIREIGQENHDLSEASHPQPDTADNPAKIPAAKEAVTSDKTLSLSTSDAKLRAIECLLALFRQILDIDLNNNTYFEIGSFDENEKLVTGKSDAREFFSSIIRRTIKEEYWPLLYAFTDFSDLRQRLESGNIVECEYEDIVSGWVRAVFIPAEYDENGEISRVFFCCRDINKDKLQQEELKARLQIEEKRVEELKKDALTGLYTRSSGQGLIEDALNKRKQGFFALLDCDRFKQINDTRGHKAGDMVLRCVASCLTETLRNQDIIMRLGGDEFVFFAPGLTEKISAEFLLKRLFGKLHRSGAGCGVSISLGGIFYDGKDTVSFDNLYNPADKCLYAAKGTQGNSYIISDVRL